MNVAIIQLNSTNDKEYNLSQVDQWVTKACESCLPSLVALPEMFTFLGGNLDQKKSAAENIDSNDPAILLLKKLAKKFNVYIHGGSICEFDKGEYFNTTCVIDPRGETITKYRKINLFNFTAQNTQYHEAIFLSAGHKICTYQIDEIKIGCAICFDLRFGNLFQQLINEEVKVIIIPSAFTYETGKAHWETLCRARAIETQSFLIAPAQTGVYTENGQERACWGHSMIVDPWGTIIAELKEEVGFVCATLDFDFLQSVRKRLPCVGV